ncbi:MAG: DUF3450 family protein [Luteolibacter sp.]
MQRLLIAAVFLPFTLYGEENDPSIDILRETISQIVDVQTLESKERLDWETQKAEMAALLDLHRKELELLDEELLESGQSAPGHNDSTNTLRQHIAEFKAARSLASESVARNVPRTLSLAERFPAPLISEAEPEISALTAWKPTDEPREALRSILSLVAKAEQFNRRFTRSTEIIENREVAVLYLGLARAFYAGKSNTAGIGTPSTSGWQWKSQPDLHSSVTTAFSILDKKSTPSMVDLPMKID